jgi:hypothetical protein
LRRFRPRRVGSRSERIGAMSLCSIARYGWSRRDLGQMTTRVVRSLHNDEVDRCVDILKHADGTFSFKEFRRDPEDGGGWTLVSYNPRGIYSTEEAAISAARVSAAWLCDEQPPRGTA